jgi:hypothetical protein
MRGISQLPKEIFDSQKGLCSMELIGDFFVYRRKTYTIILNW